MGSKYQLHLKQNQHVNLTQKQEHKKYLVPEKIIDSKKRGRLRKKTT